MPTLINPYAFPPGTMLSAIQRLGLTSGLQLCLDAGDINSYSSGQKWLDTSGNGYDFFRGTSDSSQSSDPTFNGTPGGQSAAEYWSFDGGDYFLYDSSNETWMNNLHKNNATFAWAMWCYITDLSVSVNLFHTGYLGSTRGVTFLAGSNMLRMAVLNGSGSSPAAAMDGSHSISEDAWHFLAGQVTEGAGTGFLQVDGDQDDVTSTYSSPSSSSASETLAIGKIADGASNVGMPNGSRLVGVSMWESTVPSKAGMLSLYNMTKTKFGH